MATGMYRAQETIVCDLCENPALRVCNTCDTNLCAGCITKHIDQIDSLSHDIASFKYKAERLVFPDCEFHPGLKCEAHCQLCDTHICTKCLIGNHKGHDAEELVNVVERKRQEIQTETEEIQSKLIPKCRNTENKMKTMLSEVTETFGKQEQEMVDLRRVWQKEVDDIFIAANSLIRSFRDSEEAIINSTQIQLQTFIADMIGTVRQNNQITRRNKVSEFTNYRSKLCKYRDLPTVVEVKRPSLEVNTVLGSELSIKLENFRATLLQTTSLSTGDICTSDNAFLSKALVIATIPTNGTHPFRVACVGKDKAWVNGLNKIISLFDILGGVQDAVKTKCLSLPQDISVTEEGNPIYSNSSNRTVNITRNGKSETLFSVSRSWEPFGLCCTRSGDILVNIRKNKKHKVVRYQDLHVTQEIYKDERGQQIFKKGESILLLTENGNGDLCVSDLNAEKVVVVEQTGRVRFRYDGRLAKMKRSFDPRCIVTDAFCHIIVTDVNNDCLHILDQNGNLLKYLDDCELCTPYGLSVDREGRLWVGLPRRSEIKVIEYRKYL